jgi:hypothetical protein
MTKKSYCYLAILLNSWRAFVTTQGSVPNLSLPNHIANILQEDSMTKYSPNNNTQTSTFYRRNKFTRKGQLNRPFQTANRLNMAISSSEPIPNYPSHKTPNSSIHLNPKVITCHYCNKRGHKAPKCCQRAQDRANGINKGTPHVSWTNAVISSYFMSPNLPKNFLLASQVISKATSQKTFSFDLCTITTITKTNQPLVLKCQQVGQLSPLV